MKNSQKNKMMIIIKKETEKVDKYLDLAGELKKQWNIKVIVIPMIYAHNQKPLMALKRDIWHRKSEEEKIIYICLKF